MRQYVPEGCDYEHCMDKTRESLRKYRTRVNDAAKDHSLCKGVCFMKRVACCVNVCVYSYDLSLVYRCCKGEKERLSL